MRRNIRAIGGFQDKMLLESQHAPGGVILYSADGDEEIIHVNQYVIDLFECESIDEFLELTHGSFKGFVYADDVDASEESIQSQLDAGDELLKAFAEALPRHFGGETCSRFAEDHFYAYASGLPARICGKPTIGPLSAR